MDHRTLGNLLVAGTILFVLLACSGGVAMHRGLLPPPALSVQVSRRPLIGLFAFTTHCRTAGSGNSARQQNYRVLLYLPDRTTSWETSGRFLVDMPIPC